MYLPSDAVPTWLGAAGWLATAVSLVVAALRLGRHPTSVWAAVGAAAFITSLRLLEFPLHQKFGLGGSVLAAGFAAVVFGPEVAVWAIAGATFAFGVVAVPPVDVLGVGGNLLAHAALTPWLVAWILRTLGRRSSSPAAGYVHAFAAAAAAPPLVAAIYVAIAGVAGLGLPVRLLSNAVAASLTLPVAEGVLATWGYALALRRRTPAPGDAPPFIWEPSALGGLLLICGGLLIAAAVAPLGPPQTGVFGPTRTVARFAALPFAVHALAGIITTVVAAAPAFLFFGGRRLLLKPQKTAP